jgi:hypothetical protein
MGDAARGSGKNVQGRGGRDYEPSRTQFRDTREVGEINSLNRVNLRENTLNSRWADDVQRFERIDNRVGTGDAAVFFVW